MSYLLRTRLACELDDGQFLVSGWYCRVVAGYPEGYRRDFAQNVIWSNGGVVEDPGIPMELVPWPPEFGGLRPKCPIPFSPNFGPPEQICMVPWSEPCPFLVHVWSQIPESRSLTYPLGKFYANFWNISEGGSEFSLFDRRNIPWIIPALGHCYA